MSSRDKSKGKSINRDYVAHVLNHSKTKSSFSFEKSNRFQVPTSYSPNKFYDLPSGKKNISCSMGKSTRVKFQKQDCISPNRYQLRSEFGQLKQREKRSTMGISRQSYYRAKSSKNLLGPGSYDIPSELGLNNFYMGQKLKAIQCHTRMKTELNITGETVSRLSTHLNQKAAVRLKTEYYPKTRLSFYDNKVPGPDAYQWKIDEVTGSKRMETGKGMMTTFGAAERLKAGKGNRAGPGQYLMFSEFGQCQ